MADEDRAAKAARAKAMLKKRQQQKKAGPSVVEAGQSTPGSPISRTMSPALPQVHDVRANVNEGTAAGVTHTAAFADQLFGGSNSEDVAAVSSTNGSAGVEFDKLVTNDVNVRKEPEEDYAQLVQDQQKTISLLVSEKNSLTEEIERYRDIESQLVAKDNELRQCKQSFTSLDAKLNSVNEELAKRVQELHERDAESSSLKSRLRDQDRELQLLRTEGTDLRSKLEKQERRSRELEEQIQNDDRVEHLEAKLQNTTNRAEELEFQLSKIRQSHSKLKEEREQLEASLSSKSAEAQDLQGKLSLLTSARDTLQGQLEVVQSELEALKLSESTHKKELDIAQAIKIDLTSQLGRASEELATSARLVESAQEELRQATKRAKDAEKIQRDLQEEGTSLMRSLDEMRPKIVELTGTKLELMEQVEKLNKDIQERDAKIFQFENEVGQLQLKRDEDDLEYGKLKDDWEKERVSTAQALEDSRRAFNELQVQLEQATANAVELDSDRTKYRQLSIRQQQEIELLRSTQTSQADEITVLQSHLDEQQQALDDERRLREESQAEIEALRAEVSTKEEEISQLRQPQTSSNASPRETSTTLEDEVLNSLKQRHELELSAAKSQIRSLETSVFDAESTCRALQKQVAELKDELQRLQSTSGHHPSSSLRKAALARRYRLADDVRRSSYSTIDDAPPVFYSPIDEGLPPAIRHQRQISLGMLQARMYSESEAMTNNSQLEDGTSHVDVSSSTHDVYLSSDHLRRSQFLDENHVFWCASCKGDLIVL